VHSRSASPRPEILQHTQFRFDSTVLFGNLRLAGSRTNVVASVFDFRQVLNHLLQRFHTQQNEWFGEYHAGYRAHSVVYPTGNADEN
jgi:hypothetical protein